MEPVVSVWRVFSGHIVYKSCNYSFKMWPEERRSRKGKLAVLNPSINCLSVLLLYLKPYAKWTCSFLLLCRWIPECNSQGQIHSFIHKYFANTFMEYFFKKVVLSFQMLSCIGFEEFPGKKSLQFLRPGRKQGAFYYLKWCCHLWIQIRPNIIKLLLMTGLSSSVIPVLSFEQSGVSAKIPVKCFNSRKNKGTEKVFFLFSMVLIPPAVGTVRTSGNFPFLKSRRFTSRRTWNKCCNLKWYAVQYHSSVSREFLLELNK